MGPNHLVAQHRGPADAGLGVPEAGVLLLAAFAAAVGAAINSVAGGGTLVTFPMIVALGVDPLVANATSRLSLLTGALGGVWGYRAQLARTQSWLVPFSVPSVLGGLAGGWLVLMTGSRTFSQIVPFLVLGATVLFMVQGPIVRWLRQRPGASGAADQPVRAGPVFLVSQFLVGVYGGYFGAGMGIIMLAVLGILGFTNIHEMNGLKSWGGLLTTVAAGILFAGGGVVLWPVAFAMAVGSLVGGYGGSVLAQRVGAVWVHRAVVAVGLGSFVWLMLR